MKTSNALLMLSAFGAVSDFHKKFGLEYTGPARALPQDIQILRLRRLDEELDEYKMAVGILHLVERHNLGEEARLKALEAAFDALIDLQYILLGTAELHGFDRFDEGFARVHAANMAKERAARAEDSKHGSTYDIIKPEGWQPPVLADLVTQNKAPEDLH